jgi:hypothetical protein
MGFQTTSVSPSSQDPVDSITKWFRDQPQSQRLLQLTFVWGRNWNHYNFWFQQHILVHSILVSASFTNHLILLDLFDFFTGLVRAHFTHQHCSLLTWYESSMKA